MLKSFDTIMEQVKDEDVLTVYTLGGGCARGHWYEDHVLRALCGAKSFTEIRTLVYQQNEVY
jgi:hypothetical protein